MKEHVVISSSFNKVVATKWSDAWRPIHFPNILLDYLGTQGSKRREKKDIHELRMEKKLRIARVRVLTMKERIIQFMQFWSNWPVLVVSVKYRRLILCCAYKYLKVRTITAIPVKSSFIVLSQEYLCNSHSRLEF